MKTICRFLGTASAIFALGCSADDSARTQHPEQNTRSPVIYSVNYPLAYFATRIAGEDASVIFPAPPNIDPADWNPTPDEIAAFQTADLILLNGPGHTRWVERASLPSRKMLDASASFRGRLIELQDEINHMHGPEGTHVHARTARTTWLDPLLAIEQARAITEALIQIRPQHSDAFLERFAALEADLHKLDSRFSEATKAIGDAPVLFSHPIYQYFERRYRVNGESVHWEPDEQPTSKMWREFASIRSKHPSQLMIWEATPREETMLRLESLGVSIVVLSPCANFPEGKDWYSVMLEGAERLNDAGDQLLAGES
jgi:zinc transport system substrate-binding protein